LSEVLLGKPFKDGQRIYFRLSDLLDYLRTKHQKPVLPQKMYQFLRDKGGEDTVKRTTKAQTTRLWSLPIPDEPEIEAPKPGAEEVF
jgi:hypothetical protein